MVRRDFQRGEFSFRLRFLHAPRRQDPRAKTRAHCEREFSPNSEIEMGSTRVSRVDFGVPPKSRTGFTPFGAVGDFVRCDRMGEVSGTTGWRDASQGTPEACAPQLRNSGLLQPRAFSLAPGFRFPVPTKPLKRLRLRGRRATRLKPGANEISKSIAKN